MPPKDRRRPPSRRPQVCSGPPDSHASQCLCIPLMRTESHWRARPPRAVSAWFVRCLNYWRPTALRCKNRGERRTKEYYSLAAPIDRSARSSAVQNAIVAVLALPVAALSLSALTFPFSVEREARSRGWSAGYWRRASRPWALGSGLLSPTAPEGVCCLALHPTCCFALHPT